jgi:hypothetical protein
METIMTRKQIAALTALMLASALLGGMVAAFVIGSPAVAQSGKAGPLQLIDNQGRVRAEMAFREVNGSHQPGFFLYGEDGQERAAITTLPPDGRPSIALSDTAGNYRLWLGLDKSGAPVTALYDQGQELRAAMGAITLRNQQTGQPERRPVSSLTLVNEGGHVAWTAP